MMYFFHLHRISLYKKDGVIVRFVLFLFCYGVSVVSISNCILYLNYRTLGYSWSAVGLFLLNTYEPYIAVAALCVLFIVVFDLNPWRSPSS